MSKIELNDFIYLGRLFEIYGGLLSEDRQKIMTAYFQYNMTLVEIANERKISRQAVLDAIDKSCEKLLSLESSLHILEHKQKLTENLKEILLLAKGDLKITEKVENILKEL